ncbi:MAG: diguanylate cyclase [Myxococcaceae bacterium]|nr:diguanylate cyclase [Myxococcaceae bacterium]
MNSVGKKVLVSIALPALIFAVLLIVVYGKRGDDAIRSSMREEAVSLADFIANTFRLSTDSSRGSGAREVHDAVTNAVRSDWKAVRHLSSIRIIDRNGVVRWSKKIEEEDHPLADAPRLLAATAIRVDQSVAPSGKTSAGSEVVYPLGGVACAGCHAGEATLRTGVLQVVLDEPSLRLEMNSIFKEALGSALIFLAIVSLVTVIAVRLMLTHPLRRLAKAMHRAEEGDFVARAPVTSNDEIGQLSAAFNRMLVNLTSLKAEDLENKRELTVAQSELELKRALESTNEQLQGRLAELGLLYDVARSLTSTLELSSVLQRITQLVPTRFDVPKFSIMLLNAEGQLEVKAAHPAGRGTEGLLFSLNEGVCGRAAQTRKSVYIPDLENEPSFKVKDTQATRGRGCLLSVPMVHGEELLGVLNFERPDKAGIAAEDIEFFTGVADQVALAVQNARLHEQTVALSVTDPLTGVPNRRFLFQQLELEIARANRFGTQLSLLMIDIDHFKTLNDTQGHTAGDEVLGKVAKVLKQIVRRVDTLARYGGEEFVVILPQVTKAEAAEVAEKLRRAVEDVRSPHAIAQPNGKITVSIGLANLPIDAVDHGRLVDSADAALYASKRAGRNRVTAYATGMEVHPGRERGLHAQRRRVTGEIPAVPVGNK